MSTPSKKLNDFLRHQSVERSAPAPDELSEREPSPEMQDLLAETRRILKAAGSGMRMMSPNTRRNG